MKHLLALIFISLFFISCLPMPSFDFPGRIKYKKPAVDAADRGNLIPYWTKNKEGKIEIGYVYEETEEFAITPKYVYAGPFVGNFAVAQEAFRNKSVIDKTGKVVLSVSGKLDELYVSALGSGKNHVALLRYTYQKKFYRLIGFSFLGVDIKKGWDSIEEHTYSLINLENGKIIIPESKRAISLDFQIIGDFFYEHGNLYQCFDNGDIFCIAQNDDSLAKNILQKYFESKNISAEIDEDLPYLHINYTSYFNEAYANPHLENAFTSLKDAEPDFSIPFKEAIPFHRDHRLYLNAPLKIIERKYMLYFEDDEKYAMGIYNETKSEWELMPCFIASNGETSSRYYIISITQTNNPSLYYLHLTTDAVGWHSKYIVRDSGIFDVQKDDFLRDFHLGGNQMFYYSKYYDAYYPWYYSSWRGMSIEFPTNGVYLYYDNVTKGR